MSNIVSALAQQSYLLVLCNRYYMTHWWYGLKCRPSGGQYWRNHNVSRCQKFTYWYHVYFL